MTTEAKNIQPPTDEEVATYAYYLWESAGRMDGRDVEYWLQAKVLLTAMRQDDAGLRTPPENFSVRENSVVVPSVQAAPKPAQRRRSRSSSERAYT